MKITNIYIALRNMLSKLNDISLLAVRLILAYGFYEPAMMKIQNIGSVSEWFGSMGIPLPTLNAYLAAATEGFGVLLLILGLGTRFISIPLIIVMIVAIVSVHISNGFAAGVNGFEIPLYYMIMLFVLMSSGAGRISIDHFLERKM